MKTVIFGGTFNPPHLGHERMVQLAYDAISPDRFLIIPTYIPPHKQLAPGSPSPLQRLELCHLAFDKFDFAEVSDIELLRQGSSYTFDTLNELREIYPTDKFYLIIGSDSLINFRLWYRYREILGMCSLVTIPREFNEISALQEKADELSQEFGAEIIVLDVPPLVISSTDIRRGLVDSQSLSEDVLNYIKDNHLY